MEPRLAAIEGQLAALREVPQQLSTVLETLSALHQHFSEVHPRVPSDTQRPPTRPTSASAAHVVFKQRLGQGVTATRSCSSTTSTPSNSDRARPLIGRPAPDAGLPIPVALLQRRPSTHSEDPTGMQIVQKRRSSQDSAHSQLSKVSQSNVSQTTRSNSRDSLGASTVNAGFGYQSSPQGSVHVLAPSSISCPGLLAGQPPSDRFDSVVASPPPNVPMLEDTDVESKAESEIGLRSHHDMDVGMSVVDEDVAGETALSTPSFALGTLSPQSTCNPDVRDVRFEKRGSIASNLSLGGETWPSDPSVVLVDSLESKTPDSRSWTLHPASMSRYAWDLFMVLLTILVGLEVPLAAVYFEAGTVTSGASVVFLNLVSAAWLTDIFLNFATGYYMAGKVVRCPWRIARRYARSWLALDLLTACPVVSVGGSADLSFCLLKLLRLLRLGPRLATHSAEHPILGMASRVGITVLVCSHATTCFWRLALDFDSGGATAAGSQTASERWALFVKDAYWVAMTMSTVGFGDVSPAGTASRLFAIFAMLVAPLFFGTVVSLLTHATQRIFNDEVEVQVAEAARFMKSRCLTAELQRRVEQNLRHQIHQERLTLSPAIFSKLSTAVQREVSLELLRNSVLHFPLFQGVLHSFIAELAGAHAWVHCAAGDLVVEQGQLMQEVVFVIRGRLVLHRSFDAPEDEGPCREWQELEESQKRPSFGEEKRTTELEISGGAWFGEAALFYSDRVRTVTVVAAAESELAVLLSSDYHRVVRKYPRLLQRHQWIERAMKTGTVSLRELAYMVPKENMANDIWPLRSYRSTSSRNLKPLGWWRSITEGVTGQTLPPPRP